jgi:hypothetical protein
MYRRLTVVTEQLRNKGGVTPSQCGADSQNQEGQVTSPMCISDPTSKKATDDTSSIASNLDSSADSETLVEAITQMATEIANLRATVEDQQDTIEDLRADLREERTRRGKQDADIRSRVHDVESTVQDVEDSLSEDVDQAPEAGNTTQGPTVEPQTDPESMTTMPDAVLEDQTANVRRAVFVASDVEDYTTACPAGRVIQSSELRRVLKAGTDCRGHTQTVARVMDLLDRTGGEQTQVVQRNGERRLVFEQELVDRLSVLSDEQTHRCDAEPVEAM